jgi:hypothetical protein
MCPLNEVTSKIHIPEFVVVKETEFYIKDIDFVVKIFFFMESNCMKNVVILLGIFQQNGTLHTQNLKIAVSVNYRVIVTLCIIGCYIHCHTLLD